MTTNFLMLLMIPAALIACQPNLAAVSAGHVGCAPANIEISDYDAVGMNAASWTATCGGREFACSGAGTSLSCSPIGGDPVPVPATPMVAASRPAYAAKWLKHAIEECGIEAEFPSPPQFAAEQTKTKSGSFTTYSAISSRADQWAVTLSCAKVSDLKSIKNASIAKIIDAMRDASLKAVGGELVGERPIIGGREVDFTVQGKACRERLLVLDDKLVTASVTPVAPLGSAKAAQFLQSVDLRTD